LVQVKVKLSLSNFCIVIANEAGHLTREVDCYRIFPVLSVPKDDDIGGACCSLYKCTDHHWNTEIMGTIQGF